MLMLGSSQVSVFQKGQAGERPEQLRIQDKIFREPTGSSRESAITTPVDSGSARSR